MTFETIEKTQFGSGLIQSSLAPVKLQAPVEVDDVEVEQEQDDEQVVAFRMLKRQTNPLMERALQSDSFFGKLQTGADAQEYLHEHGSKSQIFNQLSKL